MGRKSRAKAERRFNKENQIDQFGTALVNSWFEFFESDFRSEHRLKIRFSKWKWNDVTKGKKLIQYEIGTVKGIMYFGEKTFELVAVANEVPGNGHLNDLFQWFEEACRRFKMDFVIAELWNLKFKKHLIEKRKFVEFKDDYLIKKFT